jgi:EpsI family protein
MASEGGMSSESLTGVRFALAVVLIAATGLYVRGRGHDDPAPPHEDVTNFPRELGEWQGGPDLPFTADTLQVLGPGDFMERTYEAPEKPGVDLFLAYFPSQRTGDTIHSPRHCLPGAGWEFTENSLLQLKDSAGPPLTVNYYVIAKGEDRQVVLYWYQAHGRVVSSEYSAKFYQVWDAMRLNRTDGSLVRVITPVARGESLESARDRAAGFAEQLLPLLGSYIPS